MLIIYFGDMPSAIYNTEIYFKNTYEDSWILDDFAKKVIKKSGWFRRDRRTGNQKSCTWYYSSH